MFARLACKARVIEKRREALLKEKEDGVNTQAGRAVIKSIPQKYRQLCIRLRTRTRNLVHFRKHSWPYRFFFNVKRNETLENFVAKSIAGFMGGFILTYIFFMFFVLQLNFTLSTATIVCAVFGSILTIGLAFSFKVRCIVFLVLPQFFSKKGRQALLAYAYILAITGPSKNTLNNMSILGESLACGQEQLKAAVKQILELVKKPFYAIREAIKKVVATIKEIVAKIKEIMLSIKRIVLGLVDVIKSAFNFIVKVINFGNIEFGSPFERCQRAFEEAIVDCNAKLGPMFNWLCNITYLVQHVCYIVKPLDFLFTIVDFIATTIKAIITKVKQFIRHIRTMFYVRIKFSHSYHFESNHSKSMEDITTGIVTEIKERSSGLIKMLDFMSAAASVFFLFMVVKVIYYRHKFLTNAMFDNKFITKDFRELDLRRAQLGMETVLPLNHRERKLYISTASLRLVKKEKSRLSQAAMILLMSTLKLCTHMATDYSLYWIMIKIRYYGRFQSTIDPPNMPGVYIDGEGFLATLLKGIVQAFHPMGVNLEIDTIPCLPDPIPPDYDRYIQIGSLVVICWFLAIFEPYGLRFRHSVMCFYHPLRARERAIWLYNHILRSRSSFLKFARRQLRRKALSDKRIAKVTCAEMIRAKLIRFKICALVLGTGHQKYCLLCGEVYREGSSQNFIQCSTPNCPGLYCERCYNDLLNTCTVCLDPISYGDLSDFSEEKDSSEDDIKRKRGDDQQRKLSKKKTKHLRRKKEKVKQQRKTDKQEMLLMSDTSDSEFEVYTATDNTQLIKYDQHLSTDSDYDTSTLGEFSDTSLYDFEYQKYKDIREKSNDVTPKIGHGDVEKQQIPNYATMQDFHRDAVCSLVSRTYDEVLETSSNITPLCHASMQHMRQGSPQQQDQAWLMKITPRQKYVNSDNINCLSLTSSTTSEACVGRYYPTPDSETDEEVGDGNEWVPLHRLNSKLSMEKASCSSDSCPSSNVPSSRGYETVVESSSSSSLSHTRLHRDIYHREENAPLSNRACNNSPVMSPIYIPHKDYDSNLKGTTIKKMIVEPSASSSEKSYQEPTPSDQGMTESNPSREQCRSHPDVPNLDLAFLEELSIEDSAIFPDSCKCRALSSSNAKNSTSCNCRLFRDTVKYRVESEIQESTTTDMTSTEITSTDDCTISEENETTLAFNISPARISNIVSTLKKPHASEIPERSGTPSPPPRAAPMKEYNSRVQKLSQELSSRQSDHSNSTTDISISSDTLTSSPDNEEDNDEQDQESESSAFFVVPAGQEDVVSTIRYRDSDRLPVPNDSEDKESPSESEEMPSKRTFSKNTSEISVRKCSIDESSDTYVEPVDGKEVESVTPCNSNVSESPFLYESDLDRPDSNSASPGHKSQTFVVQASSCRTDESGTTQERLYKERIRSYYRHINVQSMARASSSRTSSSESIVLPTKQNVFKKMWRFIRNIKK